MVTNPYRVCPDCQRKQQVRYKGYNEQHILVFMDHYVSEVETPRELCDGSGKDYVGEAETNQPPEVAKSEPEPTVVPVTDAQPTPTQTPVAGVEVRKRTAQCPECGGDVPTRKNLRGNEIYAPHSSRRGECLGSYRRVHN